MTRSRLVAATRRLAATRLVRPLRDGLVRLAEGLDPTLGAVASCQRLRQPDGATVALDLPSDVEAFLHAIPSETTARERRLLFRFFAQLWNGTGDVLEIGPFLGGTTRAIALGMLANPRRDGRARLLTVDRFRAYLASGSELATLLAPFEARGQL